MNKRLSPWMPTIFLVLFLGLYAPVCYWLGWNNPAIFDIRGQDYPATWAEALCVATVFCMITLAVCWTAVGKAIDIIALQFVLNALIVLGYFFLNTTSLVIYGAEKVIMTAGEQAVAVNAIGFFVTMALIVIWYGFLWMQHYQLPRLPAPAEVLDKRLEWFLMPLVMLATGMIALPMLLTGTIPMLSGDPMVGRVILEKSTLGRPFYNLGSSLLPALTASLLIIALRKKTLLGKVFNLPLLLVAPVFIIQYLTSNRLPLAYTMLTFFALYTIERKFPRWFLVVAFVGFISFFLFLSGFSSILRQERELLESGNVVGAAFSQAFVGNNLADLRDGAWVFGQWDYEPLNGKTYLGGLFSMIPSAFFPQKKEWYLGLVALNIVGWPTEEHFGLRISFFAEAFLNFGVAGIVGLGVVLGTLFGYLLRSLHLAAAETTPCLMRNLSIVLKMQLSLTLANSSEGFVFWSITALLIVMWVLVERPIRFQFNPVGTPAYGKTL